MNIPTKYGFIWLYMAQLSPQDMTLGYGTVPPCLDPGIPIEMWHCPANHMFDYRRVACDDHTRIIQDREQKIEENGTGGTSALTTRFVVM